MLKFTQIFFSVVFLEVIFSVNPYAGELIKCIGDDGKVSYSNDGTACKGSQAKLYLPDEYTGAEDVAAPQKRNEIPRAEALPSAGERKTENENKVTGHKAGNKGKMIAPD